MKSAILFVFCITGLAVLGNPTSRIDPNGSWRIVGGETAEEGQFPFIISLRIGDKHNCGGSIIGKRWILCAAHCVEGYDHTYLKVVAGTNTLSSGGEEYTIKATYPHKDFNFINPGNDISLIELNEDLDFTNPRIQPITLEKEELDQVDVTLVGWGRTSAGGQIPDKLQFINLLTISVGTCNQKINTNEEEICTYTKKGEGACNGDSGGPLVHDNKVAGIVSRGIPCAEGFPDVFTRVSYYIDWINERVNGSSSVALEI